MRALFVASLLLVAAPLLSAGQKDFLAQYRGTPFHDSRVPARPQPIPGLVHCAWFDLGGEGVAYHDADAANHGSGELNPLNGNYLNEFRHTEGVDISYTKYHHPGDPIDDNPFNRILPPPDLLYVGWTEPGEWFNLTVDVAADGLYSADLLYTSNRGGTIAIDVNGERQTPPLNIVSTADPADPVAWRQWHHWNRALGLVQLKLARGRNVLTVHVLTEGQMNLATFDFRLVK